MTIGAVGAWLISISEKFKNYIKNLKKIEIGIIYLLFIFIYFFRDEILYSNHEIRIFERILIAIIIIMIILEQTFSVNSFF